MGETVRCGSAGGPNFAAMNSSADADLAARVCRRSIGLMRPAGQRQSPIGVALRRGRAGGDVRAAAAAAGRGCSAFSSARLAHTSTTIAAALDARVLVIARG